MFEGAEGGGRYKLELRHRWLERQCGDINCLVVFITLADYYFRWGGGREQNDGGVGDVGGWGW